MSNPLSPSGKGSEMYCKLFYNNNGGLVEVQDRINKWLATEPKVKDVRLSETAGNDNWPLLTILFLYDDPDTQVSP